MNKNEIKKIIYKNKPIAYFDKIRIGIAYYETVINNLKIYFEIPVNDMGDADFYKEMDAKLLLRWVV